MAFKDFAISEATSSDINTYLMKQMVITCTSGTRPSSPVAGMRIWQTDTLTEHVYDGSAWQFFGSLPRLVIKASDETVNNSTTMQDDDELFLAVDSNAAYLLELSAEASSHVDADMSMSWSAPSGATMKWASHMPHINVTSATECTISVTAFSAPTDVSDHSGGGFGGRVILKGLFQTAGTSGTLRFRWAQRVVRASDSKVYAGAYLQLIRVA